MSQPQPQPEPRRRNWFARHKILTGAGAVIAVAVIASAASAGGSNDSSGDRANAVSFPTAPAVPGATAPASGPDAGKADEVDDVKITSCEVEEPPVDGFPSMPHADLTITNNSSKTSNYTVQVEFVDKDGVRVSSGYAAANNVASNQTVKQRAQGLDDVAGETVTCRVADVERYPSF